MNRSLALVALLSVALSSELLAQAKSSSGRLLKVPYRPQRASNWCWAASGSMIMQHWKAQDPNAQIRTQCEQVFAYYNAMYPSNQQTPNCPMDSVPKILNITGNPFSAGESYSKSTSSTPLSWDSVKAQINNNMPIATMWRWMGVTDSTEQYAGNHWLVVDGYSQVKGVNYITYCDPWASDSAVHKIIPFSEYQQPGRYVYDNHPGQYRYTSNRMTYYNIRPKQK